MSHLDHMTDEDYKSMTDKIEMLTQQLELSKARTEVALGLLAECNAKPSYDILNSKAKERLALNTERAERESLPPVIETELD